MLLRKICALGLVAVIGSASLLGCGIRNGVAFGSGDMVSGEFEVNGDINHIMVDGVSATVHVSSEPSDMVTYKIDDNLLKLLELSYENDTLVIGSDDDWNLGIGTDIVFYVGTDTLEDITVSGDAAIEGYGTFTADDFDLYVYGAASVDMEIEAENVSIDISGAADMDLRGKANLLEAEMSGAANIDCENLVAQDVTISTSGAGFARVHAENTLDVKMSGAGSVTYTGDPEVSKNISGLGMVKPK